MGKNSTIGERFRKHREINMLKIISLKKFRKIIEKTYHEGYDRGLSLGYSLGCTIGQKAESGNALFIDKTKIEREIENIIKDSDF